VGDIIHVTSERFVEAQTVFRRYNRDKTWSFTDCTSFAVMKELKIKTVFTFDDHFEQMGFRIL
jgi:predicted nucleic acid-binding protein